MGCACLTRIDINEAAKIENSKYIDSSSNYSNISSSKSSKSSNSNLGSFSENKKRDNKETTISTNQIFKNKNNSLGTKSDKEGPIITLLKKNYLNRQISI